MTVENAPPTVLMIMLCMRCALGGAEKRYCRTFEQLVSAQTPAHRLLINRSMLDLLESAGRLVGYEDQVIVLNPPFRERVSGRFPRLMYVFASVLDALWYCWQCLRVIRRLKPDVVHPLLTGVYLSLPALLLYPRTGYVLSANSYDFVSYRDRRILGIPIGATLKRFAMQRADVVEALTEAIRADLIARGIEDEKIVVAPNSFTDYSECRPEAQKSPWVVFLGRLVSIKNPQLLARAAPLVLAQMPDVHFYFLGAGALEAELRELIGALSIADHASIQFAPRPTEILNRSSVFVSLQTRENYPSQALLEAMGCGNAVVATDVGETWRLVDEEVGMRVAATPEAVASAIVTLFTNHRRLQQQQAAARQRVLSQHGIDNFMQYMLAVYEAAARRRG